MIKQKQNLKKAKLMNKTAQSALNIKKTELNTKDPTFTCRPRYVQKQQWKQNKDELQKKLFFNKTQTAQTINRSLEKFPTDCKNLLQFQKSKTPSPLRQKFKYAESKKKFQEDKLLEKLFNIQRKNKQQAIVQNLIYKILGQDEEKQSPEQIIKKINKELGQLRLKNIRLERQIKQLTRINRILSEQSKTHMQQFSNEDLQELVLETFQLILITKTMESAEHQSQKIHPLLYEKSNQVMMKLNPLVFSLNLEKKLKERGITAKNELNTRSKAQKYTLLANQIPFSYEDAPQCVKKLSLKDISTSADSNSKNYKQSKNKIRQRQSSLILSNQIIEQQQYQQDLTFQNLKYQHLGFQNSQNTVICHHSKDVSYGGMISEKEKQEGSLTATVILDFNGDHENDLCLKKGEKINILKKTSNGWWIGMHKNIVGYFPAKNVRID